MNEAPSLTISYRNLAPSPSLEMAVRRRAAKLLKLGRDRLIACHVVIAAPNRRRQQGKLYAVNLRLEMPRGSIPVNRNPPLDHAHEDAHVAIRDAFDAALRRLEEFRRRFDGRAKRHLSKPRRLRATRRSPAAAARRAEDD
ncbi:MAG: HPF/RaiA family ribosome-associated protein [Pseudomonadota bacterium]